MRNYGLREGSEQEEWQKLGPVAQPTPTNEKNKGQQKEEDEEEMKEGGRAETERTEGNRGSKKATGNKKV